MCPPVCISWWLVPLFVVASNGFVLLPVATEGRHVLQSVLTGDGYVLLPALSGGGYILLLIDSEHSGFL